MFLFKHGKNTIHQITALAIGKVLDNLGQHNRIFIPEMVFEEIVRTDDGTVPNG